MGTTPDRRRQPLRSCVGCRRTLPQAAMVRCALTPGGPVVGRVAPGRGAWVCSLTCFDLGVRRRGFERSWRARIDAADLATLRIAVEPVITNMEELSTVGSCPGDPAVTKG